MNLAAPQEVEMEHWEFLLQKEGDRSWLPLDPRAEILEGRYRIVVRSSQPNTEVAIRISHVATEATPPKRRVQKRSSRTNPDGLMVLIPYTHLEPGVWGFHCGPSDLMSELVKPWQHAVQLQVLSQQVGEDWEPDWSDGSEEISSPTPDVIPEPAIADSTPPPAPTVALSPAEPVAIVPAPISNDVQGSGAEETSSPEENLEIVAATAPNPAPAIAPPEVSPTVSQNQAATSAEVEELWQLTEQLSDELINEVMQELDLLDLPEPWVRSPASDLSSSNAPATAAPFSLKLEQAAFVVEPGKTLTLTGTILAHSEELTVTAEIPDPWDSAEGKPPQPRSLWLYLRDPQSLEVLAHQRQSLTEASSQFRLSFSLPDRLTTRLLLGEVQLCGFSETGKTLQVLATQTFTVTVNPIEWVQELARFNTAAEPEGGDLPLPDTALSLDLSFLATEPEPARSQSFSLQGQLLPPQIYQPDTSRPQSLHLPDFATPAATSPQAQEAPEAEVAIAPDTAPEASESSAIPEQRVHEVGAVEEAPEDATVAEPETEAATSATREQAEPEAVPVEYAAFRALNLHQRFLSRLSSLAEGASGQAASASSSMTWVKPVSSEELEYLAEEVVVANAPALARTRSIAAETTGDTELPNPLVLPADMPVPTPDLHITTGELVAGKPVNVRVRLPNLLPRIYIKLWISDRQTRSLLEGPRWLTDLLPNGHDALETTTQLTVPLGSLELQFEAIAVEVQTQRESRKVTVDRAVVPPNLPVLSLNDFEV